MNHDNKPMLTKRKKYEISVIVFSQDPIGFTVMSCFKGLFCFEMQSKNNQAH